MSTKKINNKKNNFNEDEYRFLTENMTDVIWSLSLNTMRFTYVSPSVTTLLGYTPEEVLNKTLKDIVTKESLNYIQKEQLLRIKAFKEGDTASVSQTYEFEQICKDGSTVWIELTTKFIENDNGEIDVVGVARNIENRKQTEDALRESEEKYRLLVENIQVGISISQGNKIIYANKALMDMFGFDNLKEFVSKPLIDYLTPQSQKFVSEWRKKIDQSEKGPFVFEQDIIRKDSIIRTLQLTISFIIYNGQNSVLTSFRDITEQKKIEEENRILAESMDTAPASITFHDLEGNFIYANQTTFDMHGYTKEEFFKKNLHEIDVETSEKLIKPRIKKILETGEASFNVEHYRKDHSILPLYAYVKATEWEQKKVLLSIAIDMTKQKEAEEKIKLNESRLQSLFNISQYEEKNTQDLLDFALEEAIKLTRSRIGYIYHYNNEKQEFILNTWSKGVMEECDVDNPQSIYKLEKTGLWGEAVRQEKPILINDFNAPNPFKKGYPKGHVKLHKFMTVPIFDEKKIVAVVGVANKEKNYDDSDVRQLTLLMDAVWKITVRKKEKEELSIYNKQLKILRDIYKGILNSRNTLETIQNVLKTLKEFIAYNYISIFLFNKETNTFEEYTINLSHDSKLYKGIESSFSNEWIIELSKGKTFYFKELSLIKKSDIIIKKIINEGIVSFIQVPMLVYGELVGTLNLGSDKKDFFTENHKEILIDIANELAIAIHQYRLNEEIELSKLKLEERVHDRTAQLEKANKELESFSYSVSHDFRAPLRAINGFSSILLEDYNKNLPTEGQNILNKICLSAKRMGQLIDDLLSLSRISRFEMNLIKVNLSQIVKKILSVLKNMQKDRQVDFIIKEGLIAYVDPNLVRIMLDNLLRNAWKFTSKNSKTKIEFGCLKEKGDNIYFIRDNGVGFDMKYSKNLFGAFHRLHSDKEFEGSGIGLSIVQRIIQRHKGEIWAEAAVGKGACFYFMFLEKQK